MTRRYFLAAAGLRASGVAHDVNNVLTSIGGAAELMELDPQRHTPAETATRVKQLVNIAHRMNQQLLPSTGRVCAIDVMSHLASLQSLLDPLLGSLPRVSLDAIDESVRVPLSTAQLDQIIMNLVFNARDAGARNIRIEAKVSESAVYDPHPSGYPHGLILAVEDDGFGMSRFVRFLAMRTFFSHGKQGGTGLGLSTVRQHARLAGGSVDIDSSPHNGTTVTLTLPCLVAS